MLIHCLTILLTTGMYNTYCSPDDSGASSGTGTEGNGTPSPKGNDAGKSKKKKRKNKKNKKRTGGDPNSSNPSFPTRGVNGNAITWHNKKAELFKLATHISTFKLAGKQISPTSLPEHVTLGNRISVYEMAITPGTVLGSEDPFNKASIELFNRVRGKYTSQIPFQANDLGAVILAVANVIGLVSCADRVLDHLGFVSYESALTPEILHAALVGDINNATIKAGYNGDVDNSPNLKLALEVEIDRLQGLFMPKMALFDFAGWIFRHVYFEDKTALRGDMTLFRPSYIAKFKPDTPVHGATGVYASGLEYKDINSYLVSPNPHDARIFLAAIRDCIDALVQDDNVRTICGWLHQYVQDSPTIAEIVQSARQSQPEQNPEMDLFVAGITVIPGASNFSGKYVQQDVSTECLYFTMVDNTVTARVDSWMINYDHAPSDDDVGLSMIFTSLSKGGYLYSDPYVCTQQTLYRKTVGGQMSTLTTSRKFDVGSVSIATVLSACEGKNPTSFLYHLDSNNAMDQATLVADCEYQVRVTPDNAYNVHYSSLSSLLMADVKHPSDK